MLALPAGPGELVAWAAQAGPEATVMIREPARSAAKAATVAPAVPVAAVAAAWRSVSSLSLRR